MSAALSAELPGARLRGTFRGARLIAHVLWGLMQALALRLDFTGQLDSAALTQRWQRKLLPILGLRVRQRGQPVDGGRLIMANHVSWLDIPLIGACAPTRFVSKAEVRDWPVAGWLAEAAGTYYLRRGKHGARPLVDKLVPPLRAGVSVAIFPEGTTSVGQDVLGFHSRLFAAAIEARVPVQPVAVRYGTGDQGQSLAPFVGEDDLLSHLLRLLRNRSLDAEVIFAAPIDPANYDRAGLAEKARSSVRDALGLAPERRQLQGIESDT